MKKTARAFKEDSKHFDVMPPRRRRAASSAPDALPLTDEDFRRMKRTPRAKIIRRSLGLTQQEFAARFRIPLGTLRDWEQSAAEPDRAAQAYLTVIARNPKAVEKALLS